MSLLSWKIEYSVGVMSVDSEHRDLIELINLLYERMDARSSPAEIEFSLGEIHKAISLHFSDEERLMQAAQYAEYEEHKNDHERLLDELDTLMDDFVVDPIAGSERLSAEMARWFMDHFSTHDARLHGKLGE